MYSRPTARLCLRLDSDERFLLLAPIFESTGCGYFVTGFGEHVRGTRGSASAVSSGDDGLVLGDLGHTLFEFANGNIYVTLEGSEFFDLLGFADVEEEHVLLIFEEFGEVFSVGDLPGLGKGSQREGHRYDEPFHG